jgi:hypothetical protein
MHVCTYIYIYTHTWTYIQCSVEPFVHVCMRVSMYTCIYTCLPTVTNVRDWFKHVCGRLYTYTCFIHSKKHIKISRENLNFESNIWIWILEWVSVWIWILKRTMNESFFLFIPKKHAYPLYHLSIYCCISWIFVFFGVWGQNLCVYVCMYVCMHMFMYGCMHMKIEQTRAYACMYTRIHMYSYTITHTCMCACFVFVLCVRKETLCGCGCSNLHTYMCACFFLVLFVCVRTETLRVCVCVCICYYTFIHTYMCAYVYWNGTCESTLVVVWVISWLWKYNCCSLSHFWALKVHLLESESSYLNLTYYAEMALYIFI